MDKETQIARLVAEYWQAKNRCACYADMHGMYEDNQMVHWAKRAQTLGQKISALKNEKEDSLV